LHALAQALLPLIEDSDAALEALEVSKEAFAQAMLARWRAKLGLQTAEDADRELIDELLRRMAADRSDFTITFRRLCSFDSAPRAPNAALRDLFIDREAFDAWARGYAERLARENSIDAERALRMRAVNPKYVLRNHLAEVAIRSAQEGNFDETARLLKVLRHPFDEEVAGVPPEQAEVYAGFPPEWAQSIEVSCSS
jgi:uncharacterized protein YdiU (UPF0061 family)